MGADLLEAGRATARELVANSMAAVSVQRAAEQAGLTSLLFQAISEAVGEMPQQVVGTTAPMVQPGDPELSTEKAQRRLLSAIARAGRKHLEGRDPAMAAALNIASVDGVGYPAWTGGIARWRDD